MAVVVVPAFACRANGQRQRDYPAVGPPVGAAPLQRLDWPIGMFRRLMLRSSASISSCTEWTTSACAASDAAIFRSSTSTSAAASRSIWARRGPISVLAAVARSESPTLGGAADCRWRYRESGQPCRDYATAGSSERSGTGRLAVDTAFAGLARQSQALPRRWVSEVGRARTSRGRVVVANGKCSAAGLSRRLIWWTLSGARAVPRLAQGKPEPEPQTAKTRRSGGSCIDGRGKPASSYLWQERASLTSNRISSADSAHRRSLP